MTDSMIRVMTWNIWWRFGPRWRDRQPGIRETLTQVRPDVVALQEFGAGDGTTQAPVLRPVSDVLTDAWSAGNGPADAVTLPSTHPSAPLEAGPQLVDQRIDHIFFRPGREDQHVFVEGVQLAGESIGGTYPSDHRAVVADLRWRG